MSNPAAAVVKLNLDARALMRAVKALQLETDRLLKLREVLAQFLLGPAHRGIDLRSVDGRRRAARGTSEVRLVAKPSEELLALLAALRAFNGDLEAIHGRLKVKHRGTSGASVGTGCTAKRRTGGSLRQGGRR